MGNTPKKPHTKLLFQQKVHYTPTPTPDKPLQSSFKAIKPSTVSSSGDPSSEILSTFHFTNKLAYFSSLIGPELEITQTNLLLLNYKSSLENQSRINGLLDHSNIIETHAKLEYLSEFHQLQKGLNNHLLQKELNKKSILMSPIKRNSNKTQEFDTPSPLKSAFRTMIKPDNQDSPLATNYNIESPLKHSHFKNFQYQDSSPITINYKQDPPLVLNYKEDSSPMETPPKRSFIKPNFVHFSQVFKDKPIKKQDYEEELRHSLRNLDSKLKLKRNKINKSSRKFNNVPIFQLDLWKSASKPCYSNRKPSNPVMNSFKSIEVEEKSYNIRENRLMNKGKKINKEKIQQKSDYSQENLKKYLNKSYSECYPNQKFLKNKERNKEKPLFAENRINFLYMNYEKINKEKPLTKERENLESSLLELKRSLQFPQTAQMKFKGESRVLKEINR